MESVMIKDSIQVNKDSDSAFDRRIESLEKRVNSEINSSSAHFALAEAYFNDAYLDEALREYKIVKTLEPDHIGAYIGIAKVLDKKGKRPQAVSALEKSFTFAPDNREVLTGLFKYYRSSREYKRALDMLHRLRDVEPNDLRLYVEIEKLEKRLSA